MVKQGAILEACEKGVPRNGHRTYDIYMLIPPDFGCSYMGPNQVFGCAVLGVGHQVCTTQKHVQVRLDNLLWG